MTTPTKPVYCIDSWAVESELEYHSPCSGLYADGYATADGRYIAHGNAVVDPFYTLG